MAARVHIAGYRDQNPAVANGTVNGRLATISAAAHINSHAVIAAGALVTNSASRSAPPVGSLQLPSICLRRLSLQLDRRASVHSR